MNDPSLAPLVATRYARDLDRAAVVIVGGWHLFGAGVQLWTHIPDYAHPTEQLAAWTLLCVVILAAAVDLVTGRDTVLKTVPAGESPAKWQAARTPRTPLLIAPIALGINLFVCLTIPQNRLLETNWAWGTTGWACVLLLLRRPLFELGLFLFANAAIVLTVMLAGPMTRQDAAAFTTVLYASASIQLAVAVTARSLDGTALRAVQIAAAQADAVARQVIAEHVHAARRARYKAIGKETGALLSALADGTADPADPLVRTSCSIAAAKLRRLFAESDDVPNPLLHELRACADIAERRLVQVDIEAIGRLPEIPDPARRAIADAAIEVLTRARGHARVTVSAENPGVAVAVVADVPPGAAPALGTGPWIAVGHQRDGDVLWMEARWPAP